MKTIQNKTKRILLADDDLEVLEITKVLLQYHGHRVTTADCGPETLRIFSIDPGFFDLVILDQDMPGLKGTDVAPRLVDLRSDVPIVLYTGYLDDHLAEDARKAGIREIVSKPLAIELMLEVIDRNANGSKVRRRRKERREVHSRLPAC